MNSETMFGDIVGNLPEPLKGSVNQLKPDEQDVFLVAALSVLSGLLPNYKTTYHGRVIEANLYVFICGGFGGGKGAASYARHFAEPVHQYVRSLEQPAPEGKTPQRRMHFLPANSSKSAFLEALANNGRGQLFESESDTLSDILKQDYGAFSDVLRASFHHETARFMRRQNSEYFEIIDPSLSVLLTGTPNQMKRLVPSVEDGLMSRFLFYLMPPDGHFANVFEQNEPIDPYFRQVGENFLELYKWLLTNLEPVRFIFTEPQQQQFLTYFQELKTDLSADYGEVMQGVVNRYGLQFTRLAMILTICRAFYEGSLSLVLTCSEIDYQNAYDLMQVFISSSLQVFSILSKADGSELPNEKRRFVDSLPAEFNTTEAILTAEVVGLPERSMFRFLSDNLYFEKKSHGNYINKLKNNALPSNYSA
ncbi:MAG: DUF3987 domain-containing protein [Sphingobacteriia bacterium]|nr:DUF3987 domain-containing protein [Sphingobacteriia bacterium]